MGLVLVGFGVACGEMGVVDEPDCGVECVGGVVGETLYVQALRTKTRHGTIAMTPRVFRQVGALEVILAPQ